ncbi:hypothetical protein RAA17_15065 [Komagataeibacter rhaeticus]|nr:hypothetical protein [Komagataeibacter rhaeticus]
MLGAPWRKMACGGTCPPGARAPGPSWRQATSYHPIWTCRRATCRGNLQKLIVAREARDGPRCMIAVYPTRGLDIGAVEEIWALLRQLRDAGCAIMLISADLDEIMALSDRVAVLYRGSLSSPVRATELGMDDVAAMMSGTGGAA